MARMFYSKIICCSLLSDHIRWCVNNTEIKFTFSPILMLEEKVSVLSGGIDSLVDSSRHHPSCWLFISTDSVLLHLTPPLCVRVAASSTAGGAARSSASGAWTGVCGCRATCTASRRPCVGPATGCSPAPSRSTRRPHEDATTTPGGCALAPEPRAPASDRPPRSTPSTGRRTATTDR